MMPVVSFPAPEADFDRFGATCLRGAGGDPGHFLDLTSIESDAGPISFFPMPRPGGYHFYKQDGRIESVGILGKITRIWSWDNLIDYLSYPGIHHLMGVKDLKDGSYALRGALIIAGTIFATESVGHPRTMQQWLDTWTPATADLSKYPHRCPRCGSAAYIGLNEIDCWKGCA